MWSIYGAGGKLRPTPCPVLMNGFFVGLWKQAESLHLPPYGQAYTSPVASGHSEHLQSQGALEQGLLVLCSTNWTTQMFPSAVQLSVLVCGFIYVSQTNLPVSQSPVTLHLFYILVLYGCERLVLYLAGCACLTHI